MTRLPSILFLVLLLSACREMPNVEQDLTRVVGWLPTGVTVDPAGPTFDVGPMPLKMLLAPEGDLAVMMLSGWGAQGVQVVRPETGEVVQTLEQPAGFVGLVFDESGENLYASGGNQDVVYRYAWSDGSATLVDSLVLAYKEPDARGERYPAGLALSSDGQHLYVAENLADVLAVVDLTSGRVVQRLETGRYPYEVAVRKDGRVFVSVWGADHLIVFDQTSDGSLDGGTVVPAGRHPSALLMNASDTRLFVASASTDRTLVLDTETLEVVATLDHSASEGPAEGSTPNAFALSDDGARLYVAEADNNAVAVFDLSAESSDGLSATVKDALAGRLPVGWYPTALAVVGDQLWVANGKGRGTAPNDVEGPQFDRPNRGTGYTLAQISGTFTILDSDHLKALNEMSSRVAAANNWNRIKAENTFPPFEHVIYIIKENRTYDQVFGDMPEGDGDPDLVYFPRAETPNHHALADRFGLFDRFFVNAEVSPDGHNWSMAAYTTDYLQKTVPSVYSGRGRSYDYEGTNRGEEADDDATEPAMGYLWDLAARKGISFRNFGEFVVPDGVDDDDPMPTGYKGLKPFLLANTEAAFPGYDLSIQDQIRADVWLDVLDRYKQAGEMPALQIVRLPNDHTSGASAGAPTPTAQMADNDLALGRIIEGLSKSPFWATTVVFVVEDDAQNGPDHVDSHRAPFLVISPYNRPGVVHRFVNTTDALATMEAILDLDALSQFDYFGRPLTGIFADEPDLTPYEVLTPATQLDTMNPERGIAAEMSARLDFTFEDIADEDLFNRVLWHAIKGADQPYPGIARASMRELEAHFDGAP